MQDDNPDAGGVKPRLNESPVRRMAPPNAIPPSGDQDGPPTPPPNGLTVDHQSCDKLIDALLANRHELRIQVSQLQVAGDRLADAIKEQVQHGHSVSLYVTAARAGWKNCRAQD